MVAGLQVPLMPLVEVPGRPGGTVPEQKAGIAVKVGVTFELTVTFRVAVVAHWPGSGLKVYMPEAVLLMVAGLQVPVMPLFDVPERAGATDPEQNGGMALKVGMIVERTSVATPEGVLPQLFDTTTE
jgi:hypothetical protein